MQRWRWRGLPEPFDLEPKTGDHFGVEEALPFKNRKMIPSLFAQQVKLRLLAVGVNEPVFRYPGFLVFDEFIAAVSVNTLR